MTMQENNAQHHAISAEEVSDFLRKNPHFFEKNAGLLTEIYLPSPHGSGAISLAERQQLAQRDKIRVLEVKLAELIEFAEENDATSAKVHDLSVKLMAHQNFSQLQQVITEAMQKDFAVTQSLLRIWLLPKDSSLAHDAAFAPVDEAFSDWILGLSAPFCGAKPAVAGSLMGDHLQSFAFIPLSRLSSHHAAFGVLVLASDVPHRFKSEMGTMYLERIGELVAAALLNHF
jgi:uncharacterized protein YigA (DUF484 family)